MNRIDNKSAIKILLSYTLIITVIVIFISLRLSI
jgi:hypothetical protein